MPTGLPFYRDTWIFPNIPSLLQCNKNLKKLLVTKVQSLIYLKTFKERFPKIEVVIDEEIVNPPEDNNDTPKLFLV